MTPVEDIATVEASETEVFELAQILIGLHSKIQPTPGVLTTSKQVASTPVQLTSNVVTSSPQSAPSPVTFANPSIALQSTPANLNRGASLSQPNSNSNSHSHNNSHHSHSHSHSHSHHTSPKISPSSSPKHAKSSSLPSSPSKSLQKSASPSTLSEQERKKRKRVSDEQLAILETVFATDKMPDQKLRLQLAEKLNMSSRRVQIWFQNKRAKLKKTATSPIGHAPNVASALAAASLVKSLPKTLNSTAVTTSTPPTQANANSSLMSNYSFPLSFSFPSFLNTYPTVAPLNPQFSLPLARTPVK